MAKQIAVLGGGITGLAAAYRLQRDARARGLPLDITLFEADARLGGEPVAAFMRRRLGREAFDRLIEPLMSGIYAGDADRLSLAATFPQLRQMELAHGGLLRGVMGQNTKSLTQPRKGAAPRERKDS